MKYFSSIALVMIIFASQFSLTSCNNTTGTATLPGAWDRAGDFEGIPRSGAVSFVINGLAYVGTGFNSDENVKLNDFWRYDPIDDSWLQIDSLPGIGRSQAVAFAMNGKGYVGTGIDINTNRLSDFYEYDPANGPLGTWRKIKDFGYSQDLGNATISPRFSAVAFSVANRGFVGGGRILSSLKDLWEYLPNDDVWVKRPSIGGSKRENAFAMVIDDIAYVGGGTDNGIVATDFYRFDVSKIDSSPWSPVNGLTGRDVNGNAVVQPRPRESSATFSINGFGYLTTGSTGSDCWQYTPPVYDNNGVLKSGDIWVQYFTFTSNVPTSGLSRVAAVSFGIDKYGYVTTGNSGGRRLDDCWRFDPAGVEPDNK